MTSFGGIGTRAVAAKVDPHKRTMRHVSPMSALPPIVLQNSDVFANRDRL